MDLLKTFYLTQQLLPVFFFGPSQRKLRTYIHTCVQIHVYNNASSRWDFNRPPSVI